MALIPGPRAAKARARVRLADGRTGTLVHWPVYGRRDRRDRKPCGGKACVVIAGRRNRVPMFDVVEVVDDG